MYLKQFRIIQVKLEQLTDGGEPKDVKIRLVCYIEADELHLHSLKPPLRFEPLLERLKPLL